MLDLVEKIAQAEATEIDELFKAVLKRYRVLFPDWEIGTISLQKSSDRNEQLDKTIELLRRMKTSN